MIWLSAASLIAGVLLAQRFKIMVMAPATFVVVVLATAVRMVQPNGFWSMVFIIAIASVGIQIGYFLGMLARYGLTMILARRASGLAAPTAQRGAGRQWPI